MVLLYDSVDSKKLDVRLIERNINRGVLKPEELDEAIKNLPDDAENADWVNLDLLAEEEDLTTNGKQY